MLGQRLRLCAYIVVVLPKIYCNTNPNKKEKNTNKGRSSQAWWLLPVSPSPLGKLHRSQLIVCVRLQTPALEKRVEEILS